MRDRAEDWPQAQLSTTVGKTSISMNSNALGAEDLIRLIETLVPASTDPNYHLTADLADRSIAWVRKVKSIDANRPFFLYVAPGATHTAMTESRTPADAPVPRADPLALDPYGPIYPTHAPRWNDPDPLALDPYGPIRPTRAPAVHRPATGATDARPRRSWAARRVASARNPSHPAC